ncbi:metal ABC transporter substrate-binding protein [Streptomyces fragilis]|uniref:Metal ABC transporter substrate-binding protein n=1 Tax=Streptomyces fragilis TaxID=67301 RepID=A0ABV2YJ16_9ACTN|nr:metal ABC transporter substrate-binding protein [Streptomyces fragilis]
MNVRRLISATAAATAVALGATALTACSGDSAAYAKNTEKFDVVASFYPMAFLAEEIGGKNVNVTTLVKPGQEPHDLEITARQTASLTEADAILYLQGLQPAVDEAVAQTEGPRKIDAAALTDLEKHGAEVDGHAEESSEAHADEHAEESGDGHEGHDHSHEAGGKDPHVWLDPAKYGEVAEGVSKAFQKADPEHAADYRANTEDLVNRLDALDKKFQDGLKDRKTDVFLTNHSAFGYLAEAYGLIEESLTGLDPESEPSAARVKELQHIAKEDGVTTVFYETLVSDRTARTVAKDAGLRTDVLDPLEGITEKSRGDDYFQVMEANLAALQKALEAK